VCQRNAVVPSDTRKKVSHPSEIENRKKKKSETCEVGGGERNQKEPPGIRPTKPLNDTSISTMTIFTKLADAFLKPFL